MFLLDGFVGFDCFCKLLEAAAECNRTQSRSLLPYSCTIKRTTTTAVVATTPQCVWCRGVQGALLLLLLLLFLLFFGSFVAHLLFQAGLTLLAQNVVRMCFECGIHIRRGFEIHVAQNLLRLLTYNDDVNVRKYVLCYCVVLLCYVML
jgi:hypothetical protein